MEEMPNPTSQEATRSVLGPEMWFETLRLVIAPRIARVVREHPDIENRQQLHRTFCELHSVKMSYSTFSGWCEDLGITFRKRIEVRIPGWKEMPRPTPEFVGPMPAQPVRTKRSDYAPQVVPAILQDDEETVDEAKPVVWDEPVKPSEMFSDNIPNILPGGMRPPSFLNQSDYAN
jgi:hypothetical protein